jgi:hypothetical protein
MMSYEVIKVLIYGTFFGFKRDIRSNIIYGRRSTHNWKSK